MKKEPTENSSSIEQEISNLEKIAAEYAKGVATQTIEEIEKQRGRLSVDDYFNEYDYAFYFAYADKLEKLKQQQGLQEERKLLDPEVTNIQQERFRKEIIENARPLLEQILSADETNRVVEALNEEFASVSEEPDYMRRLMAALDKFYKQTLPCPKGKEINSVIARVAMEELAERIKKITESLQKEEKGDTPDKNNSL